MRRIAAVFVVLLALIGLGACAKYKFGSLERQETVVLRVEQVGADCVLSDPPPDIRTSQGRTVTWLVVGSCSKTVTIDPELTKDGKKYAVLTGDLREAPGPEGRSIKARVASTLPEGLVKAHLAYHVKIDGAPAKVKEQTMDGDQPGGGGSKTGSFFICPMWPCDGGFSDY